MTESQTVFGRGELIQVEGNFTPLQEAQHSLPPGINLTAFQFTGPG
jgi:hypothetical protein